MNVRLPTKWAWAVAIVLAFCTITPSQQSPTLSGVVSDRNGAPVANAVITFRTAAGSTIRTAADDQGRFNISDSEIAGTLTVSSPGFTPSVLEISSARATVQIRLEPAAVIERIDVSAREERIPATPSSIFSLGRREIETSGALTIDEVLRQIPGFSLFRRAGSLFANPTTQGVSLRGIGANGASRALVLLDGVPLNSPFGGWIYWTRVPQENIQSVEVYNGGSSDAYGSGALGGVVNIASRRPSGSFFGTEMSFGNENTPHVSFTAAKKIGKWTVATSGQALRTGGYIVVTKADRGTIDTEANTADLDTSLTVTRHFGDEDRLFLRLDSFAESRNNGTPLQVNNTRVAAIDGGTDWRSSAGSFSLRVYGSREVFNQSFSAIAADRNSESLTNRQRNPSQQFGGAFQWERKITGNESLTAGAEIRDVRGHSAETTFSNSRITAYVDGGGRQNAAAVFAHDTLRISSWFFNFGGRLDHWSNNQGFSSRIPVGGPPSVNEFVTRSENAFSPRIGVLKSFQKNIAVSGSFYRGFRAPTLNELYRSFRVGNVVTNANASLRSERMTGGDFGLNIHMWAERINLRSNAFWSKVNDPVSNVTLSATPALIARQRQNLGAIRARGVELSASAKLSPSWEVSAEYLLTDSVVVRFPANRTLEGLELPQVPRNEFNFQIGYAHAKWFGGLQGRLTGKQFDDDQNLLALAKFFTIDAELSRSLNDHTRLFIAVQNLNGVRYQVSRTPVVTVGPPTLVRGGVRFSLK
jgi:outer membrane receptor protein involved in Fe transport